MPSCLETAAQNDFLEWCQMLSPSEQETCEKTAAATCLVTRVGKSFEHVFQDGYCISRAPSGRVSQTGVGLQLLQPAGTSGRTDAFAHALPMWLSSAMVLQFLASPMSFPGLGRKAISASLSSCGTRPVVAVSVHVAAMACAHADSGACAHCPTTAFHCSATAPCFDLQDFRS